MALTIKKKGKDKWRYSAQLVWALKRSITHEISRVEFAVKTLGKTEEFYCGFSADCFTGTVLVYRISGKAVFMNGSVHLLISDRITY